MQRVVISGAFAALAYSASAAVAARGLEDIKFVDQTWEELCEGSDWTIKWSAGNGKNTKISIKGDDNWSQSIGESKACPGEIDWTVTVPKCDKEYTVELKQDDCESLESPKFYVACAAEEEWNDSGDASKTWSDNGSVTVVYYDEDCTCTKSKATPAPTHNNPVWYDDDLKCSVTVEQPKPTGWDDSKGNWADAGKPAGWDDSKGNWADAPAAASGKPAGWDDSKGNWADAPAAASGKPAGWDDSKGNWADAPAAASGKPAGWDDSKGNWADAPAAASGKPAGWDDSKGNWADATTPAAATGSGWADNNVAPATATPKVADNWADASKPAVAEYKGAATQLAGSFGALAAVLLAALAL